MDVILCRSVCQVGLLSSSSVLIYSGCVILLSALSPETTAVAQHLFKNALAKVAFQSGIKMLSFGQQASQNFAALPGSSQCFLDTCAQVWLELRWWQHSFNTHEQLRHSLNLLKSEFTVLIMLSSALASSAPSRLYQRLPSSRVLLCPNQSAACSLLLKTQKCWRGHSLCLQYIQNGASIRSRWTWHRNHCMLGWSLLPKSNLR